jgi:hypothetical protein
MMRNLKPDQTARCSRIIGGAGVKESNLPQNLRVGQKQSNAQGILEQVDRDRGRARARIVACGPHVLTIRAFLSDPAPSYSQARLSETSPPIARRLCLRARTFGKDSRRNHYGHFAKRPTPSWQTLAMAPGRRDTDFVITI